ncbi:MAG TPA: hypothetical protein VF571_09335 [Pyrinomonadaceae bacterium]|jgi:hypothetical protein
MEFKVEIVPSETNPEGRKDGQWDVYVYPKNDPAHKSRRLERGTYERALRMQESLLEQYKDKVPYPK